VHDLVAALGKPIAQLVGCRRDLDLDFKSAPGEKAFRLRGKQRQVSIQAYRYLRKIDNRLTHNPGKLMSIEAEIVNSRRTKEVKND